MSNDMVVVELLIHLRQSQSTSAAKSHHHHLHSVTTAATAAATTPFSWGLKQRRSRLTHRWKEADSTRCSPTTPLSWSAASDESTQQPSRSKVPSLSPFFLFSFTLFSISLSCFVLRCPTRSYRPKVFGGFMRPWLIIAFKTLTVVI